MAYTLAFGAIAPALNATTVSASLWTKGLPRRKRGRFTYLRLADVVSAIRGKRRYGLHHEDLKRLVALDDEATDLTAPVEGDAARFVACLSRDESDRLAHALSRFRRGAVQAFFSRSHHIPEGAFDRLCLFPPVTRYVLTGDPSHLPFHASDYAELAATYVLASADAATIKNLSSNKKEMSHEAV